MLKRNKIIQIIIFVIVAAAVGSYFLFFNKGEKIKEIELSSLEKLLIFNNKDSSLSAEQIEKYKKDFEISREIVVNDQSALNPTAWLVMARIKKYIKDYEGAEQIYLFLTQRDINNYIPEANLADLYANYLFDYNKAADHYWQAVKKASLNKPVELMFYRNLADIYAFKLPDKKSVFEEKAIAALKNEYQGSVDFMTMLAKYYKDSGNKEKAIEYLEKALTLDSGNQAIKDELEFLKK